MKNYLLIGYLCVICTHALCQTAPQSNPETRGPDTTINLYRLTTEKDILNLKYEGEPIVQIMSASALQEDVNKSPYAVNVLHKKEIEQSGAVSIPEALRLLPGLLVLQKTSGQYEVYLAGSESLPFPASSAENRSKMLLVLINNMPVNNAYDGSVLWETLPISLGDIDKIELVRNPSSVLFGRDAARGVINLITADASSNKMSWQGELQAGSTGQQSLGRTLQSQGAVNFGVNDKLFVRLSGNYISENRFENQYFLFEQNRYTTADSLLFYKADAEKTNLYGSLARQGYGINASLHYNPQENISSRILLSRQDSRAQDADMFLYRNRPHLSNAERRSLTHLINVNSTIYKFNVHASYLFGDQNLAVGYPNNEFRLRKLNAKLYYSINFKEVLFSPGIGLQHSSFESTNTQSTVSTVSDPLNGGRFDISNYGVFLKAHLTRLEGKLILDGGSRYDFHSFNNQSVFNYQLAGCYTIWERLLMRTSFNTGSTGNYLTDLFVYNLPDSSMGGLVEYLPNSGISVSQVHNLELGLRLQATDKIRISVDVFHSSNDSPYNQKRINSDGGIHISRIKSGIQMRRKGITASINASLSSHLKLHAFATMQHSNFDKIPEAFFQAASENIYSPEYFGGITADLHLLTDKLTFFFSGYAYSKHYMMDERGSTKILANFIPSLKLSYKVWQENSVFINIRNVSGYSRQQFIYADHIPALYLIGLNSNL